MTVGTPGAGSRLKLAVTVRAAVIETVQVPVPLHPDPDQPVNVELLLAEAVKSTEVADGKDD